MTAAILQAAGAGIVMMHGAIRAHLVHRHIALGRTSRRLGGHHTAGNASKSRLRGEHRDQSSGDDLEELLHPLRKTILLQATSHVIEITNGRLQGIPVAAD